MNILRDWSNIVRTSSPALQAMKSLQETTDKSVFGRITKGVLLDSAVSDLVTEPQRQALLLQVYAR